MKFARGVPVFIRVLTSWACLDLGQELNARHLFQLNVSVDRISRWALHRFFSDESVG